MWSVVDDIITQGNPIDIALFCCGLVVLGMVIANAKHGKETRARLIRVEAKYELLNTHSTVSAYIIEDKLGIPTTVQGAGGDWHVRHPYMNPKNP